MAAAHAGVEAVEQQYKQANWAFWMPQFRLQVVATIIPPQSEDAIRDGEPDLTGTNFWSRTDLEGYWPLYTFGKLQAVRKAASHGRDIGREALRLAAAALDYQVRRAWHTVALAAELAELIVDGEKELKKAKDRLQKQEDEDSDEYDQDDKFRLRIYDAQVHRLVLDNRRLAALARVGLRVATAHPASAPLPLPEPFKLVPVGFKACKLKDYMDLASRGHPDLSIARHKVAALRADADRHWADFFPDFFLAGNLVLARSTVPQQDTAFSSTSFNATGGGATVGFRLTLDYGQKVARWKKAKAEVARARAELELAQQKLRLQVETGWREVRDLQEMVGYNERAMKAARSLFVSKVNVYEDGVDDSVKFKDVLDASITYVRMKSEWLRTVYDFNLGTARLSQTVGADLSTVQPCK